MRKTSKRSRDERGLSSSVELAVLVPALVLLLGVMISAGRYWHAQATVDRAAQAAARAASLQRDQHLAATVAGAVATSELQSAAVTCRPSAAKVNTAGFSAALGQSAQISVTVSCTVQFKDLVFPGMPGSITAKRTASSVLDRYRGRQP